MIAPLCECGCGLPVGVATQNTPKYAHVKGQPYRFRGGHQRRLLSKQSYPCRRNGATKKLVRMHRLRAERALGKPLPPRSEVHHLDGSKSADAPLVICESVAYHQFLHIRARVKAAGGNPNTERVCRACGQIQPMTAFVKVLAYCEVATICKRCAAAQRHRGKQAA